MPAPNFPEHQVWPGGSWARHTRFAFLALLEITGKPSIALRLMDELELWRDHRRPPDEVVMDWTRLWRAGGMPVPNKIFDRIQKQYDGRRKSDLDETLAKANMAHRHISQTVIDGTFEKDTSGALQHLGQILAIGTEKRQQAFEPKLIDDGKPSVPQFVFLPPPERRALPEPMIEGEVVGR